MIPFPRKLDASVRKQRHFTQDELDAVITLAVLEAHQIDQEGWEPPVGNLEAKKRFLAEADPLSCWLEVLPDSYDGRPVRDVWDDYNQQEEAEITLVKFGRQVGLSPRWESVLPGARAAESSQETRIALIRALELAVGSRDTLRGSPGRGIAPVGVHQDDDVGAGGRSVFTTSARARRPASIEAG